MGTLVALLKQEKAVIPASFSDDKHSAEPAQSGQTANLKTYFAAARNASGG
jgi:hypothetical protein